VARHSPLEFCELLRHFGICAVIWRKCTNARTEKTLICAATRLLSTLAAMIAAMLGESIREVL